VPLWVSLASLTLMDSFFTIAFASFVEAQHDFSQTFSGWLKVSLSLFIWNASQVAYRCWAVGKDRDLQVGPRTLTHLFRSSHEHFSQVLFLRQSFGTRLSIFSPVNDLSSLSKSGRQRSLVRGQTNDVAISGGQVLGDEYSDHVVKVRILTDRCVVGPS
jgi:hypothetical protein